MSSSDKNADLQCDLFKCASCEQEKTRIGRVNVLLSVLLAALLVAPFGVKICDECAHKFTLIAVIIVIILIPVLLAVALSILH